MHVEYFVRMDGGWNCLSTVTNVDSCSYVNVKHGYKKLILPDYPYILRVDSNPTLMDLLHGRSGLKFAYYFPSVIEESGNIRVLDFSEVKRYRKESCEFIYLPLAPNDRMRMEHLLRERANTKYMIHCHDSFDLIERSYSLEEVKERRSKMRLRNRAEADRLKMLKDQQSTGPKELVNI